MMKHFFVKFTISCLIFFLSVSPLMSGTIPLMGTIPVPNMPQIKFDKNEFRFSSTAAVLLTHWGKALSEEELKDVVFEIHGYACKDETNPEELCRKRANEVKEYLVGYGISEKRLKIGKCSLTEPDSCGASEKCQYVALKITNTKTDPVKQKDPFNFDVVVLRSHSFFKLEKGQTLTSRDDYYITFAVPIKCYLYIFQVSSQDGTVSVLFPNENFSRIQNPVSANQQYRIPYEMHKWLQLDDSKGKEEFIALAYSEELPNPEKALSEWLKNKDQVKIMGGGDSKKEINSWKLEFNHQ